jgi:hypothetical protein
VNLKDLIDRPDEWSYSKYIEFRLENYISSGTTLEAWYRYEEENAEILRQREEEDG